LVHIIQEVTNWTRKPVVLLKAPATSDKSKQKSMNDTEKKGDESKVRRKRKSQEEAKEDENLAKRIMTEGGDIERNERQQGDLQKFQDALKDMNGSVALSEVQIKCGICSKSYACRHTDRTFNGKVSYFKARYIANNEADMSKEDFDGADATLAEK
ncbi:unnamed protein product, partial [Pocillopora meandrina]